ncbi:MAG: hypothetical protein RLY70_2561 [Planctomycetota bacterium]
MSVLQPLILAALPLAALPVIIHLINQRRFQTVRWGAMMFLMAANRMARGYARLRQWLILALRVLGLIGLIVAVSRPLASGWLGLAAGGRIDTTIILLDRSSSMSQQEPGASRSKLRAAVEQLASTLRLLGSNRWILIDSQTRVPHELKDPDELLRSPDADPTSAASDIPGLLDAARQYVRDNKTGRTEIWIASDLRRNDWDEQNGRWEGLRAAFLEFPQTIRFHLLSYADTAADNMSVRVTRAQRRRTAAGAELLLSLTITRDEPSATAISVPLRFEIEGASSELTVEFTGNRHELRDHPVPLDATQERGWGRVSLPTDGNPSDNEAYFVFAPPPRRQTILVADQASAATALQASAGIPPDSSLVSGVDVVGADQLASVDWDAAALVLWQSPLPSGEVADTVRKFVDRGGQIIFFPPENPGAAGGTANASFLGHTWRTWVEPTAQLGVDSWRGDQDLLANTQDGSALPVGDLQIRRFCQLEGDAVPLATLKGGQPLVARAPTDRGGVFFVATTTQPRDSSLAENGVVLYVMIQRALAAGAAVLGDTREVSAGELAGVEGTDAWTRVAGPTDSISTDYGFQRGVYAAESLLFAVNRPVREDDPRVIANENLAELFRGLDFRRVDDQASRFASLVQEVWRSFLLVMMLALLGEAALCIPKIAPKPAGNSP